MTLDALLRRLGPVRADSASGIPYVRFRADMRAWHVRVDGRHVGYFAKLTRAVRAAAEAKGVL